jgi:hypothetical protein
LRMMGITEITRTRQLVPVIPIVLNRYQPNSQTLWQVFAPI